MSLPAPLVLLIVTPPPKIVFAQTKKSHMESNKIILFNAKEAMPMKTQGGGIGISSSEIEQNEQSKTPSYRSPLKIIQTFPLAISKELFLKPSSPNMLGLCSDQAKVGPQTEVHNSNFKVGVDKNCTRKLFVISLLNF
jgi:hypothetical protein